MPANNFLAVFAKSPIKPLEQHINKVVESASLLKDFFEASYAEDWKTATDVQRQISIFEQEADQMKRDLRLHLPSGLFMAVARTDMLSILSKQDEIANIAKDVAGRATGRQMSIPEELREDFMAYVCRCIDATKQAKKAINELDDLLETGFSGRVVEFTESLVDKIEQIEDDTDRMQRKIRATLWGLEKNLNPVDVMFLYQLIESLGAMADAAQGVGNRLELVLAR